MISWSYALGSSASSNGLDTATDYTSALLTELALDPVTWDLAMPIRFIHGPKAVAQRIRVRFRFFKGEWFLDQRLGVPYFEQILIKNPDLVLVNGIFRQVLRTTPGVKSVASFNSTLDKVTRTLTADFEAVLATDQVLTAKAEPFIIGG